MEKPRQVIVVLSIDGFRYDYLDLYPQYVPTLLNMRKKGVYVDKLKPSFPTKTFPNHYTIATGQYVQSHGMVSNKFYDKKAPFDSKIFTQQLTDPFWWEQGEPIWITAQKQVGIWLGRSFKSEHTIHECFDFKLHSGLNSI